MGKEGQGGMRVGTGAGRGGAQTAEGLLGREGEGRRSLLFMAHLHMCQSGAGCHQ